MRHLPPLNYLQAFEAAARLSSFTEAARELNCTQAAISQRVRALETYFGRPLFRRLPSGVQLTEAGAAYLPGIAEGLDRLSSVTNGLVRVHKANTVTVSAPLSFASLWLAPRIGTFCHAHPEVDIRINCTIWSDPNSEISDLHIQLRDIKAPGERAHRLTRERALVACSPQPTKRKKALSVPADLRHHRLIHVVGRYDFWGLWAAATRTHLLEHDRIEADNAITALEIAAQGCGVALTWESFIAPYREAGSLITPFSEHLDLGVGHYVLESPNRPLGKTGTMFLEWLVAAGAS